MSHMELQRHLCDKLRGLPADDHELNGYREESVPVLNSDLSLSCTLIGRVSKSDHVADVQSWPDLLPEFRDHLRGCGITQAKHAQPYLWPYIWKGKDALCVGQPKTGKTTAYLIPLIAAGLFCKHKLTKSDGQFSFNVFICPTVESAQNVTSLTRKLIPPKTLKVVCVERATKLSQKQPDLRKELRNEADIVIATPAAFLQIVDESVLSLKFCSRIVFDEADKLLLMHMTDVKQIYLKYVKAGQERLRDMPGIKTESVLRMCKTIVIAEKFTKEVADFQTCSHSNSIGVVTDNFEAAIHSGVEFKAYFATEEKQRTAHLTDSLSQAQLYLDRIIVCCCTQAEAAIAGQEITKFMIDNEKLVQVPATRLCVVDDETTNYTHSQTRSKWCSQSPPVLVVSDDHLPTALQMTGIRNAQCIIHFSVPTDTKTKGQFAQRFNLMSDNFKKQQQSLVLLSVLILTNENSGQAHELTELYERLGLPVPENLLQLRNDSPRGLCRRMASTGHCPFETYFCYKDHFLVKDPDETLPLKGQVKFFIGNIVTANELYVRIMETRDDETKGEWKEWPHQLADIADELSDLRDEEYACIAHPEPGQMFAVIHGGHVRRVRVLEDPHAAPLEYYEAERRKYVHVFHVDYGSKTFVERRLLIPLTNRLKEYPALAHRVFVIGVKPPENLVTWSPEAFDFVRSAFEKEEFHHMSGWIFITASGCMWLQDVKLHHRLKSIAGGIETIGQTLTQALIANGHAVPAPPPPFPEHNDSHTTMKTQFRISEQWKIASNAFIPADEMVVVNLIHFKSLAEFYVRRTSFDSCLRNLEQEMLLDDDLIPVTSPQTGLICMQRYSHAGVTSLNRAVVLRVKKNGCVDVFYLDHGEDFEVDADTLYQIRKKHIEQLPFQAIKCRLDGVDQNSDLDPEVVYDMTRNEEDEYKNLLVKRVRDPIDDLYDVTLHELVEVNECEWVYRSLHHTLSLPGIGSPSTDLLRIAKPVRVMDDDDDEELHSHRQAEQNFKADIDEMAGKLFQRIPFQSVSRPGFTARGAPGEEPQRSSAADADEEYGMCFQPPPRIDYEPGDFDYKLEYDLSPDPIDPDDAPDCDESDDDLDLDHPSEREHVPDVEIRVGEDGVSVLHINQEEVVFDFPQP